MHKIPEGSDKHPMVVVGLLAGLFTCADKHRQACWAAAGCVGVAEHFERLDPLKDHNDLLSKKLENGSALGVEGPSIGNRS
jgi:hypothetical protein